MTITKDSKEYGYVGYYAYRVINDPNCSIEGDFVFSKVDGNNALCLYTGNATQLSLPENYKGGNYVIGGDAFYKCSGLTSITIPNSVTSIGSWAFRACSGLASVTIPNSVTSIGEGAFNECSGLVGVMIGNSVTSIGEYAFDKCNGIKIIKLTKSNPPTLNSNNFTESQYVLITLYVPNGSLAAYQAADGWKEFNNIVEFDPTSIEDVTEDVPTFEVTAGGILFTGAEGKVVAVYTTSGALVENINAYAGEEITLDNGVYIIHVGDKAVKIKL